MIPGKYNIICPQGTTVFEQWTYEVNNLPVDLFGYTARMQVRESYKSTAKILDLTTANGGVVLGGAAGTVNIIVAATVTATLFAKEYVYDLELISPSNMVYRLMEGKFIVTSEVTR